MSKKNIIIVSLSVLFLAGVIFFLLIKFTAPDKLSEIGLDRISPVTEERNIYIGQDMPKNDQDADGVIDEVEEKLGTKSNSNDTDGDGLTDKIEIETYKTDPIKPDTDGDGVMDGVEVVTGQNPLGKGLLKK